MKILIAEDSEYGDYGGIEFDRYICGEGEEPGEERLLTTYNRTIENGGELLLQIDENTTIKLTAKEFGPVDSDFFYWFIGEYVNYDDFKNKSYYVIE